MLHLSSQGNTLKDQVIELAKKPSQWKSIDNTEELNDFPVYTEDEIRALTLGVYQVKLAKSYTREHLKEDGTYEIKVCKQQQDLLSAKIQSRHVTSKQYLCWIKYAEGAVLAWYCQCKMGARVVGPCAHITSVIWYLAYARHSGLRLDGSIKWLDYIDDASKIPDAVDANDSEGKFTVE